MDIRPFTIDVPEEQLVDIRHRITATNWPDREVDPSQGVRLDVIQALARYWATDYDWRAFERRVFPDELYPAPLTWAERAHPKLIHCNGVGEGRHSAAWEQPQTLSAEPRATFRSLR